MSNPYVKSNYERQPLDHYPTVDNRTVISLHATWQVPTPAIDPFHGDEQTPLWPARNGYLRDMLGPCRSVITNPPYKRPLVDELMEEVIKAVRHGVIDFAAALMRLQFDCAKSRASMFHPPYAGKTIMTFRPWWFPESERTASPIHNYQWLIWDRRHKGEPVVRYHNGAEDE